MNISCHSLIFCDLCLVIFCNIPWLLSGAPVFWHVKTTTRGGACQRCNSLGTSRPLAPVCFHFVIIRLTHFCTHCAVPRFTKQPQIYNTTITKHKKLIAAKPMGRNREPCTVEYTHVFHTTDTATRNRCMVSMQRTDALLLVVAASSICHACPPCAKSMRAVLQTHAARRVCVCVCVCVCACACVRHGGY